MIHLVLISVIILAPWFLYKNPSRRMILFYQRMSYSTHCRLFYGNMGHRTKRINVGETKRGRMV
jgi:hypothetical protein